MNLPEKFTDNMKKLLGSDYESYIASFSEPRHYGLRVNTLKTDTQYIEKHTDFLKGSVPWCETGYYYDGEKRPAKHPFYYAGLYYIQEPSAMAPVETLDIKEGERVLDICAAPGGKSTQIAAKLNGKGVLVTNDISPSRAGALVKNIELSGVRNNITLSDKPEKISSRFVGFFDKILVDAPCSGEGMFRKEPDTIKSWNEEKIEFCVNAQRDILESCAKMLRPGGRLVYSTCTFAPLENEKTINGFLDSHSDFDIIDIPKNYGFMPGMPECIGGRESLKGAARLFPFKLKGEGHFMCLMEKRGESERKGNTPAPKPADKRMDIFERFCDENIKTVFNGNFIIHKDSLFLQPYGIPDIRGIRTARSGWHLGDFKKDRFEPSYALASALKKEEAVLTADFTASGTEVIKYLKGETLEFDSDKSGYCLVTTDGFSLGWAKLVNGRLKNKYPGYLMWE